MNTRSTMRAKVEAYLADRRRAGFTLKIEARQLARFACFVDESGYRGPLTVELASRWATASRHGRRLTAARRIEVLRGFTQYCQTFDPATEIPPSRLFGPTHRRLTPHIYTEREIRSLLTAAASLFPPGGPTHRGSMHRHRQQTRQHRSCSGLGMGGGQMNDEASALRSILLLVASVAKEVGLVQTAEMKCDGVVGIATSSAAEARCSMGTARKGPTESRTDNVLAYFDGEQRK